MKRGADESKRGLSRLPTPVVNAQALETTESDFHLLETLEWRDRGAAVWGIVNGAQLEVADVDALTSELWSDVAMAASSVAAVRQQAARMYGGGQDILQGLERESAAITSESPDAVVSIDGYLDPLSSEAQKLAPVLLVLREQLGSSLALCLALNPARDVGSLPIKSYYRYAAPTLPPAAPPAAFFDGLPSTKTLTLGMDVSEMWLVAPSVATHDLDNLRLEDLGSARGMSAEFELENILVTGALKGRGLALPGSTGSDTCGHACKAHTRMLSLCRVAFSRRRPRRCEGPAPAAARPAAHARARRGADGGQGLARRHDRDVQPWVLPGETVDMGSLRCPPHDAFSHRSRQHPPPLNFLSRFAPLIGAAEG